MASQSLRNLAESARTKKGKLKWVSLNRKSGTQFTQLQFRIYLQNYNLEFNTFFFYFVKQKVLF